MNLYQRLNSVLNREQRGIARITGDLGGGSWAAKSQGGGNLVLHGEAAANGSVFYDTRSNRILGSAPDVPVVDLSV